MPKTQRISEIDQCVADFLLDARAAGRADGTVAFYRLKLGGFVAFLNDQGVTEPTGITPGRVRAFLSHLQDRHSAGGVHAYWRAVRAFVRFLVREDVLEKNPLDRVRAPKLDQALLDPVGPDVFAALLETCDRSEMGKRDRAIFLVLLDSGLRAGELCALRVGDLDLADNSLRVRKGKGGKGRIVFVGAAARRALRAYLRDRRADEGEPLFLAVHTTGECGPLTYDGLRAMVGRRAARAGVAAPTLHSFRRAFALAMLRSGADVVSLSRLMGHGSLPVVQRYLKQLSADLGVVHARHSPADNLTRRKGA